MKYSPPAREPRSRAAAREGAFALRCRVVAAALALAAAPLGVSAHWNLDSDVWLEREHPEPIPAAALPKAGSAARTATGAPIYYENAVRVLGYHDVFVEPTISPTSDVFPDMFQDQMEFLGRAGYKVIPMSQVKRFLDGTASVPPNAVAITFDDAYRGQYWHAYPLLKTMKFPATWYVHSGYVGVMTSKDHSTWAELAETEATGLFDTQSHTVNHVNLSTVATQQQLESELQNSKATIEQRLNKIVDEICFPYGGYNTNVIATAEALGYRYAETTKGGLNLATQPRMEINRNLLGVGDTLATFKSALGFTGTDPGGPLIIDNTSAGFTNVSGFTQTGSTSSDTGFHGTNFRSATATTGSATASVRWTFTIPGVAKYRVYAWWPGNAGVLGENIGATYTITQNSATVATFTTDQTAAKKARWNLLGEVTLSNSSSAVITLTNRVTSGTTVYADAIKLQQVAVPAGFLFY